MADMMMRGTTVLAALLVSLCAATVAVASDVPAEQGGADVCLALAADAIPSGAWVAVTTAVGSVVESRPELFPDPSIVASPASGSPDTAAAGEFMLAIHADAGANERAPRGDDCERDGQQWLVRLGRAFLVAGAERMLELAPTTPGIASSIHLDWHPGEAQVRTRLVFAGPLDIPSGQCWIDDRLAVDASTRQAVSHSEQGIRTSLFAEAACERFFNELTRGGAGEQAITLLPVELELADGRRLRFEAQDVSVEDDAIVISGSLGG